MKLTTVKRVTIVAHKRLEKKLTQFLQTAGITGYTYWPVYGKGPTRVEDDTSAVSENIQFTIIVPEILSISLMKAVAEKYFFEGKLIIFQQDAAVLRPEKF